MTKDLMDDMLKRPVQKSITDGLNELQFGIVFLLWGGILIALDLWSSELPAWASWSWLPLILVVLFLAKGITPRLRERWIYPRIGYFKIPIPVFRRSGIVVVIGGILGGLTAFALAWSSQFRSSLPVILGLVFAAGNFFWWMRLRIRRLLVYAVLTLPSGLLAGWTLPAWIGSLVVICALSAFYFVGGFLAFRRLVRLPLPVEDQP